MSEFSSSLLVTAPKLPSDCFYGRKGGFEWKKYLIALDADTTALPTQRYEVSIFSPKSLDWLLLISPDGYHINFDNPLEALRAGFEWVECDIQAEADAFPLSAKGWKYNKTNLSNGMALWLIAHPDPDCGDSVDTIQPPLNPQEAQVYFSSIKDVAETLTEMLDEEGDRS
jgi:hypothetical protein